jgi:hypothetical protein
VCNVRALRKRNSNAIIESNGVYHVGGGAGASGGKLDNDSDKPYNPISYPAKGEVTANSNYPVSSIEMKPQAVAGKLDASPAASRPAHQLMRSAIDDSAGAQRAPQPSYTLGRNAAKADRQQQTAGAAATLRSATRAYQCSICLEA